MSLEQHRHRFSEGRYGRRREDSLVRIALGERISGQERAEAQASERPRQPVVESWFSPDRSLPMLYLTVRGVVRRSVATEKERGGAKKTYMVLASKLYTSDAQVRSY